MRDQSAKQKALGDNEKREFKTSSGIPLKAVYTSEDLKGFDEKQELGLPGEYPYTRGPYSNMYRDRLWTKRQLTGRQTPEIWNQRHKEMVKAGQTGINIVPCSESFCRGVDADMVDRELVGTCGIPINSLQDLEITCDGMPLDQISSTLQDASPFPLVAMYFAMAEKQGIPLWKLQGTTGQGDFLANWMFSRQVIHFPLEPYPKMLVDHVKFCNEHVPRWNPLCAAGQHMSESGSTPVQELGFLLSSAIFYCSEFVKAGMPIDSFAPKLSLFFGIRSDFFEELAKIRAGRRMWAKIMKERFGAEKPESCRLRFHGQTSGLDLAQRQPLNNLIRGTLHTLIAVFGGAQSIHTDTYEEALWTPTPEATRLSIMTQNIIAEETGIVDVVDPLGGGYFVETLTNEVEKKAWDIIETVDKMGGMLEAVKQNYPQGEIKLKLLERQRKLDSGESTFVGMNKYTLPYEEEWYPPQEESDMEAIDNFLKRLDRLRQERNQQEAREALSRLRSVAESGQGNLFEALIQVFKANCTLGEAITELQQVFGVGIPPCLV